MKTPLTQAITAKRDELIALTQDLIRIPTLNPPGQDYLAICEYLDKRLKSHGFETQLIAPMAPPVTAPNIPAGTSSPAARVRTKANVCIFNSHTDVVEVGAAGPSIPSPQRCTMVKIYGAVPAT